jgi:nicotinamide/nicotinate riboside kinase
LNEQKLVPVDDEVMEELANVFQDIKRGREEKGEQKIIWGLVDGFLLYWNKVTKFISRSSSANEKIGGN